MCAADCFLNYENTQNIDGDIELCRERSKTVKFIRNTLGIVAFNTGEMITKGSCGIQAPSQAYDMSCWQPAAHNSYNTKLHFTCPRCSDNRLENVSIDKRKYTPIVRHSPPDCEGKLSVILFTRYGQTSAQFSSLVRKSVAARLLLMLAARINGFVCDYSEL